MRRLLVSGGIGFLGSNLVRYLLRAYPEVEVVNLDALTYAGNPSNRAAVDDTPALAARHQFVQASVWDAVAARAAIAGHDCRGTNRRRRSRGFPCLAE